MQHFQSKPLASCLLFGLRHANQYFNVWQGSCNHWENFRFDLKWAKLLRSVNSTNCNLIRGLNFRAQFIGDGFADWFSKPDPAEPDFQTGEDPVCDRFMVNRGS